MLSQHSSASNEHYTPSEIIEAARLVMGDIDLDPATTLMVNHQLVKAKDIFTQLEDGFAQQWEGRVWLNPPGGKIKNKSSAALWWDKLVREYNDDRVKQAVFLGFSTELFATSQGTSAWIAQYPFCVPRKRIEFLRYDTALLKLVPGDSPTHTNVIVYLPPKDDPGAVFRFAEVFEQFGAVR